MRANFLRFAVILAIMALPPFLEQPRMRLGALAACLGLSLTLGLRWYLPKAGGLRQPETRSGAVRCDRVHHLSGQLQEVVRQTERAALEINDRVLTIIGRARAQQQTLADAVGGLSRDESAGGQAVTVALAPVIEAMAAETASLSKDVNSVIGSLQFQDLTKQQLERVIHGLQDLRSELAAAELCEAGPALAAGGTEGPIEEGRQDG